MWESVVSRLQQCASSSEGTRDFVASVLNSVNVKVVESMHDDTLAAVYAMPTNAATLALKNCETTQR
ncbi:MAG: hypothetical protein IPM61_16895 [Chlorobi bacterium]|nr:hypothetical protein [Chlorobiota bacterium]